jgi:hypothetical protein
VEGRRRDEPCDSSNGDGVESLGEEEEAMGGRGEPEESQGWE